MNKIKLILANPKKNINLAKLPQLLSLIEAISEQLLPQFCILKFNDSV